MTASFGCHDSSANAKKWEVELHTLKNNNARLTTALQESTANVEEWKKQLAMYKEESARMKLRVSIPIYPLFSGFSHLLEWSWMSLFHFPVHPSHFPYLYLKSLSAFLPGSFLLPFFLAHALLPSSSRVRITSAFPP